MSPTLTIFSIFLQPYNEESKKERERVKEMAAFKEREKMKDPICFKLTALGLSTYQLKDPICSRASVSGVVFVMGEGAYKIRRWILVLLYMHSFFGQSFA